MGSRGDPPALRVRTVQRQVLAMSRNRLPPRGRVWALWGALVCAALGCQERSSDLLLVGTVERTLIELVAPVSERIIAIEVERGDEIQVGDVAVRLDPTLALAELASAEAEAAGARTASVIAGQDYKRSRGLRERDVISEQALDAANLARDEAAARLWAAESRVSAARKRVADHTLVAPVSGVVDQLPFDAGERVPAGAVLAVILADSAPWVRVWLPPPPTRTSRRGRGPRCAWRAWRRRCAAACSTSRASPSSRRTTR
jgi:HlyD family secretion protein